MTFEKGWFKRQLESAGVQRDAVDMMGRMLDWYKNLQPIEVKDIAPNRRKAGRVAVFSADMINGFCKKGALASPRVDAISLPVAELFKRLYGVGVNKFALLQEWHDEQAKEFESFPPHGIRGTEEAEMIPELSDLPFSDIFNIFRKNALTPAFSRKQGSFSNPEILGISFEAYLASLDFEIAVVVGNCTDLCVRELAMYIRMWANEHQKDVRVVIPEDCVETFDMPFEVADELGAMPHPGDVHHVWALYEMARNGIDVVRKIL